MQVFLLFGSYVRIWHIARKLLSYFFKSNIICNNTAVCQRPRKQKSQKTEDMWHTSVLFTGIIKLPNSAFHISKTTKPISTKFIYFLSYIYTTSHIKIEGNRFSSSWEICYWKLPNFLHIFLHKITNIFKLHKNNLLMFWFLSNVEHQ